MKSNYSKKILLTLAVLMPIVCYVVRHYYNVSEDTNMQVLQFPDVIELGDRERGEKVQTDFTIKNLSPKLVKINNLRTSCGCTGIRPRSSGAEQPVVELTLAPYETVEMVARISVNSPANSSLTTHIKFDICQSTKSEGVITFHVGRVKGGVFAFPDRISMGSLVRGSRKVEIVDVYDDAEAPRSIASITNSNPEQVKVRIIKNGQPSHYVDPLLAKFIGQIEIDVNTDRQGDIYSEIGISASDGTTRNNDVTIAGCVELPIQCKPSSAVLPRISNGNSIYELQFSLRSLDNRQFTIIKVDTPSYMIIKGWDNTKLSSMFILNASLDVSAFGSIGNHSAVNNIVVKVGCYYPGSDETISVPLSIHLRK